MKLFITGLAVFTAALIGTSQSHAASDSSYTWGLDRDRGAITNEMKQWSANAMRKMGVRLRLVETDYVLFYNDLDPTEATKRARLLDRTYLSLCRDFNLPKNVNIWYGKAVVFAFEHKTDWVAMEQIVFKNAKAKESTGFCHNSKRGDVVITAYRQRDESRFAAVLVHEATHGFLHRYRSQTVVPNWVSEGLAEAVSQSIVPVARYHESREKRAIAELHTRGSIGKQYFTCQQIEDWQYGASMSLTKFMIRSNHQRYVAFINGLKDGMPWQESLERNYGTSVEKLINAYGQSVGIKGLRPY